MKFFTKLVRVKIRNSFSHLLIIFFLFGFTSVTYAQNQKVQLTGSNITLREAFDQIEKQSNLSVDYDANTINVKKVLTSLPKGTTLSEVMTQLLQGTNCTYAISGTHLIISTQTQKPQPQHISGTVVDASTGEKLPGVIVMIQGTTKGTQTGTDGKYTLDIPNANAVLVVSFMGYEGTEIRVNGLSKLDISLKAKTNVLSEVVVVGYGTQKKSDVSGAITTVSAKSISLSPAANLSEGLAGRISGVVINNRGGEPGNEGMEIFIRGKSTTGDASPLYVIDGIVRDYNALSFLPPSEIESISVLKDASAAIYGSRAANGVILVTTKRGKLGKALITINYNQGLVQPERIPKSADAYTYASMVNLEQRLRGLPQPYSTNDLELYRNGTDPLNHPNTNWQKIIFRPWANQERADVSVTGGNESVKYFIASGFLNEDSPFKDSYTYNKEYHFRSNIDAQITNDLKVSFDVSGRLRDNVSSHMDWAHIFLGLPTQNGFYPNGLIGSGRTGLSAIVMARDPDYGFTKDHASNFMGTLSAEYKIPGIDGLKLQGSFAYDFDNNYQKNWQGVTYYYIYDPNTQKYNKMQSNNVAAPSLNINYPNGYALTSNIKLSYIKTFSQIHTIDAFIGFEQNRTQAYSISAGRTNYASGSIQELFAGDANSANQSNNGYSAATGRENVFGRALYTYMDKYNLQVQFRYDGSQNFPVGKRYGFFPGVSGNWNISKENFLKNVKWLDFLKLRASWGELGNDKVGPYQYLTSYGYGNNYAFGGTTNQGLVQTGAPNPNITWEVAKTTDIGLETGLFNGLLTAELDVFRTYRSNILATRNASVPAYTGLTLPNENIGKTKNQGFEINLSHASKLGHDFNYTIAGNFTYAKNTVIFADETPGLPSYQQAEGKSMGTPVLYETIGIFKDQAQIDATPHIAGTIPGNLIFKDMNSDGIINSLDQVRQPYSTTPRIVYGLNFRFDYKQFELILGFQGQGQVTGEKYSIIPFDPVGWGNFPPALAENVWSPENPNGTNPVPGPSFDTGTSFTTWRYASAAFLKLKNAELSYSFSNQLLNKAGFKSARVYLNGTNLLFIHDNFADINLSPELTNWGWGLSQQRVLNLGISVTF